MSTSTYHKFQAFQQADSGWIQGVLQDDDTVIRAKGYSDATMEYLIFATETGVCTIKLSHATAPPTVTKTGWLDQLNMNDVAWDGTYLYTAFGTTNANGDIGRIALATLFDTHTPTAITQANPGQVTVTAHGLANNDEVHFKDVGGMVELDDNTYTVTVVDADNFTIGVDTTGYTAFTSGGSISYRDASAYTSAYGSANGMFGVAATYRVSCIDSAEVSGTWYLVYAWGLDPNYNDVIVVPTIFLPGTSTLYKTNANVIRGAERCSVDDAGTACFIRGPCAVLVDVTGVSGANWNSDAAWGNLDDDFEDATIATYAGDHIYNNLTFSEASGKIIYTCAASSDNFTGSACGGALMGDFAMEYTGLGGTNPTISGASDLVRRVVQITNPTQDTIYLYADFFWDVGNARIEFEFWSHIIVGGVTQGTYNVNLGAAPSAATANGYKYRATRSGTDVICQYDIGAGWVDIGSTITNFPQDTPLAEKRYIHMVSLNGRTTHWWLYDMTNSNPETCYSEFTAVTDMLDISAKKNVTTGTSYIGIANEDDGISFITVNTSDPEDSTVVTYGNSGYDNDILTSDSPTCVALDWTGAAVYFWCGYTSNGIDYCKVAFGTAENINTTIGKTIDNQISSVYAVNSCVYATGSGAATEGAGYLSDTVTDSPTDTDGDSNAFTDGDSDINTYLSWDMPDDVDWEHSRVYRRVDAGAWNHRESDGDWGTGATYLEFGPYACELAHMDPDIVDGYYEYKVTQVSDGGYESDGTTTGLDLYIDEPIATVSVGAPGGGSTDGRGVELDINGNSGDDTGNVTREVDHLVIQQNGESDFFTWYPTMGGTWPDFPMYIQGNSGSKQFDVTPYDVAGQAGSTVNTSITFTGDPAEATSLVEKTMFGTSFISDRFTPYASHEYSSEFEVENVQDLRLGKIWRGETYSSVESGGYAYYIIRWNFETDQRIRMFSLLNHNLGYAGVINNSEYRLLANASNPAVSIPTLPSVVSWNVDIGDLMSVDPIGYRPNANYQWWWIWLKINTTEPNWTPQIGRALFVDDGDYWQPTNANPDVTLREEFDDTSVMVESDEMSYEAVHKELRRKYDLRFSNVDNTVYEPAQTMFRNVRKSGDVLIYVDPGEYETGPDQPTSTAWKYPPYYCQFDKNLVVTGQPAAKKTFTMKFREIVGTRSLIADDE